jgi:hypothetical protein
MEDPNDQENLKLKLPRRFGKFNLKPPSPKDTTPIIMNGNPIDRSDLTPIVEDKIFKDSSNNPKINLLETPNAVHNLFLNDKQQNFREEEQQEDDQIEENQGQHSDDEEEEQRQEQKEQQQNISEEEEEEEEQQQKEPRINYRKFNPPFPEDKIMTLTKQQQFESSSPQISNRLAYVESVESTLESPNSYPKQQPKITSPTDINLSPENKQKISSYPSKNLIQSQLPIKNQSLSSYNPNINSSPPSSLPKLLKEDKSPIQQNPPPKTSFVIPNPNTNNSNSSASSSTNFGSSSQENKNNTGMDDLIGKAHDCFLKYQILQKSWPEYKFPNLDEKLVYQNPQLIVDTYNKSVERIQIDMDVNQYKIALIIMFLVIEVVCVKFLGLDAGGYTLSQIKAMNRYEKLLIEIGEKRLLTGESNWPPEVRILFIGLLNCGLFILMKYLSSVLGPDLVGYISPIVNGLFSGVMDSSKTANLPDEIPQRQQDITGMLGSVASMAANALSNNGSSSQQNNNYNRTQQPQRASRRPVYRE